MGMCECILGSGFWRFVVFYGPPRFPAGPHSRVTAPVSPLVVPAGWVDGRGAGGAWRGGVGVCRYEQCGELWCRLVQAGCGRGGAHRMRTRGASPSASEVSDMPARGGAPAVAVAVPIF